MDHTRSIFEGTADLLFDFAVRVFVHSIIMVRRGGPGELYVKGLESASGAEFDTTDSGQSWSLIPAKTSISSG